MSQVLLEYVFTNLLQIGHIFIVIVWFWFVLFFISLNVLTHSLQISSVDNRLKFFNFYKEIQNSHFHSHPWIQHENCIKMSTNKPSIGAVVSKLL